MPIGPLPSKCLLHFSPLSVLSKIPSDANDGILMDFPIRV